ncbi:MAG: RidA family protein [Mucilaginibacter sp.]
MPTKTSFNTPKVPRSNMVIPQAVIAGNLVFVSGTTGVDPETGKLMTGGFEAQAFQAFRNVQTIVEEAGSSLEKIVKITVFMVHGEDPVFTAINKVYSSFFPDNPPARSAPQVMPFPGEILVSVECIAML